MKKLFSAVVLITTFAAQASPIDTVRLNQCVQDRKDTYSGTPKPFTVSAMVECKNGEGTRTVVTEKDKAAGKYVGDWIPFTASKKLRYAVQSGRHIVGEATLQEKKKTADAEVGDLQYEYGQDGNIKAAEVTLSCTSTNEMCLMHCDQIPSAIAEYSISGETQRNYSEDQIILWAGECAISQNKASK